MRAKKLFWEKLPFDTHATANLTISSFLKKKSKFFALNSSLFFEKPQILNVMRKVRFSVSIYGISGRNKWEKFHVG